MVVRHIGVLAVGIAALLTGCGGTDAGSAALPTPGTSDDDQIRKVLFAVVDAGWDADKTAELTCQQYRSDEAPYNDMVPPMESFPAADVSAIGPEKFAQVLGEQFPGATPESLRGVADAVVRQDQSAYVVAMTDVMKKSSKVELDKVDNIKVNGDAATADVTVTFSVGNQPPNTRTTQVNVVREDGQWKDCTPPEGG
ncbi:MAG TPA: hypothetical protein VHH12_15705 [Mycobacterium sp.]|nr:hypothetical protein [Mycobacterium sp.]